MNIRECTDADVGALLHAYEIGGLAEKDVERFEIHVLQCDHCYEAVQAFAPWAELLRTDRGIRSLVREAVEAPESAGSRLRRWGRYLWPPWPLPFRPAVIYLVILVLLYPTYRWWQRSSSPSVRDIQAIMLVPSRASTQEGVLKAGRDAAVTFVYRGAIPGKRYQVRLTQDGGAVIFTDGSYTEFDKYETGHLLLPADRMRPGGYFLEITDPEGSPPENRQTYHFQILP